MAVIDDEPHLHGVGLVRRLAVESVGSGGLLDAVDKPRTRRVTRWADVPCLEGQALRRQLCRRQLFDLRKA